MLSIYVRTTYNIYVCVMAYLYRCSDSVVACRRSNIPDSSRSSRISGPRLGDHRF